MELREFLAAFVSAISIYFRTGRTLILDAFGIMKMFGSCDAVLWYL